VDAATGERKWAVKPDGTDIWNYCYGRPLRDMFYCYDGNSGDIYTIDPDTGVVTTIANEPDSSITVVGDYLMLLKWPVDGTPNSVSLMDADGKVMWRQTSLQLVGGNESMCSSFQTGGIVVINDDAGTYVVDLKTGEVFAKANGSIGVVDQGRLWLVYGSVDTTEFTSSDGVKWKIDGGAAYEQPSANPTAAQPVAPLTITAKPGASLVSWVESDGTLRWSASIPATEAKLYGSTYDGKHLLLNDEMGNTWALSPKDGSVLWQNSVDTTGLAGAGYLYYIILGDDTVVIPIGDGLTAYNATTGEKYWFTNDMWVSAVSDDTDGTAMAGQAAYGTLPVAVYRIDPALPPSRVPSMPDSIPSCPDGWTPALWSDWGDGHALVCSGSGTLYYVQVAIDAETYTDTGATATPTGGFTASFSGGRKAVISLGGVLTQFTAGRTTTSYVAAKSWAQGVDNSFDTVPTSSIPACAKGSYPLSLSTWTEHWLFTCGTAPDVTTSFTYYDGSSKMQGKAMTPQGDMTCGTAGKDQTVCFNSSSVTVTVNGKTDTYTPQSSYITGA